jgi:hypothetical protein
VGCKNLHNQEPHNAYPSSNIFRAIKSKVYGAWADEKIYHVSYSWWRNLKERDHLENLGVGGRIILKYI